MKKDGSKNIFRKPIFWLVLSVLYLSVILFFIIIDFVNPKDLIYKINDQQIKALKELGVLKYPPLDIVDYTRRLTELANNPPVKVATSTKIATTTKITSTASTTATSTVKVKPTLWPVQAVPPLAGAILPFKRIIAYYGNFYSKGMGALGQYPEDEMLARLDVEVNKWTLADPNTPAIPAIHYIAVTAQEHAGADGKYRLRMPDDQMDKAVTMAAKINGVVFLDVQVGLSTVNIEIPLLETHLKLPQVHLGIDPEFSIKVAGKKPGQIIGTFDAADINFVIDYLAKIVRENNLPPKILVIHRFTQPMVTNYKLIKIVPEVQVVMHMDGWGTAPRKLNTYREYISLEPVQFAGFKIFYKNDSLDGAPVMTPEELLKLTPRPIYIQYQ